MVANIFPKAAVTTGRVRAHGNSDNMAGSEPALCQEDDGVVDAVNRAHAEKVLAHRVQLLAARRKRGQAPHTILPSTTDANLIAQAYRIAARGQLRDLAQRKGLEDFAAMLKAKGA